MRCHLSIFPFLFYSKFSTPPRPTDRHVIRRYIKPRSAICVMVQWKCFNRAGKKKKQWYRGALSYSNGLMRRPYRFSDIKNKDTQRLSGQRKNKSQGVAALLKLTRERPCPSSRHVYWPPDFPFLSAAENREIPSIKTAPAGLYLFYIKTIIFFLPFRRVPSHVHLIPYRLTCVVYICCFFFKITLNTIRRLLWRDATDLSTSPQVIPNRRNTCCLMKKIQRQFIGAGTGKKRLESTFPHLFWMRTYRNFIGFQFVTRQHFLHVARRLDLMSNCKYKWKRIFPSQLQDLAFTGRGRLFLI